MTLFTQLRTCCLLLLLCLATPMLSAVDEAPIDLAGMADEPNLADEMEAAGPGDQKEFTINSDDDLSALAVGDVYRNESKTYFTVVKLTGQSADGGTIVFVRSNGSADPGTALSLVRGAGPKTITESLSLLDLYAQGGAALHPISLLLLATIILGINGLWVYRHGRQIEADLVAEGGAALQRGDLQGFADVVEDSKGLFAVICRAMIDRWGTSTLDDIRERVPTAAAAQINRLRGPVKFLNLIAVAAPLLGLLGTIVGMVIVFEGVATTSGAAKASILASGIRVKLFCTAYALIVAVPALFLYFYFNQRLNDIIGASEILAEQFMHKVARLKRREGMVHNELGDWDEEAVYDEDTVESGYEADPGQANLAPA